MERMNLSHTTSADILAQHRTPVGQAEYRVGQLRGLLLAAELELEACREARAAELRRTLGTPMVDHDAVQDATVLGLASAMLSDLLEDLGR